MDIRQTTYIKNEIIQGKIEEGTFSVEKLGNQFFNNVTGFSKEGLQTLIADLQTISELM